jgi:hypothetical protein
MEDMMYGGRRWQLEFIGNIADTQDDLKWAKELESQFLVSTRHERCLDVGLQLQVNPVAHGKVTLRARFVSLGLHSLLGVNRCC